MDVSKTLGDAQTAVTSALTNAFASGNTKLVLAAAAGAAVVGVVAVGYHYAGAAADAIAEGCGSAVEYVAGKLASFEFSSGLPTFKITEGDVAEADQFISQHPEAA